MGEAYIIAVTRHIYFLLDVLLCPHFTVAITTILPSQHGQKGEEPRQCRAHVTPPALNAGGKPRKYVLAKVYPLVRPGAVWSGERG